MFVKRQARSPRLPDDRMRDEELPYAAMLEAAIGANFHPAVTHRMIRVHGDSLRRLAETEAEMWQSEVVRPAIEAGKRPDEILGIDFGDRMSTLTERSVVAMYHLQQTRAWTSNIIENLEAVLAQAGLHSRLEHPPAMCFFDISGYTRLTQERGDEAAASLAEHLGTIVQRTSVRHGGRPVKWLGDGVMLHFPNPGRGVEAALEMVVGCVDAGLPPAHVGLHAGPVDLPGRRLLRFDGQRRLPDRRLRATRRGDGQPGRGRCVGRGGRRLSRCRPRGTEGRDGRDDRVRRVAARLNPRGH